MVTDVVVFHPANPEIFDAGKELSMRPQRKHVFTNPGEWPELSQPEARLFPEFP
jgi:hypothetical protein